MLQSHENWKIEHSQITRNLPSSLGWVGLTWLSRSQVTKGTGSVVLVTRHSSFTCTIRCTVQCVLYSTGLLHLYNMVYSTVQYSMVQYRTRPHLAALLDVDVWVAEDGGRGCDHHQPHPSAGGHHTLGWDQESMPTNPPLPLWSLHQRPSLRTVG